MIIEMNAGSPILVELAQMPSQSKRFMRQVLRQVAHSSDLVSYVIDGSKPTTFLVYLYPNISADNNQDKYAKARQGVIEGCNLAAEEWRRKAAQRQETIKLRRAAARVSRLA